MIKALASILLFGLVSFGACAEDTTQVVLSDAALQELAGDAYASGDLPLGDHHYTINEPQKGFIDLCQTYGDGRAGAHRDGGWIHTNSWNVQEKVAVAGHVDWPIALFTNKLKGASRILTGNGLPTDHDTGIFPVASDDPAFAYDRNPNKIRPQGFRETLPANPTFSEKPFCMGMEVGTMLNGVPLYSAFDAGLRDAPAHELMDACQGHPENSGIYHYHNLSSCIRDTGVKTVIGYALDGFPITGPTVADGKYLVTDDLDVCHGITSEVIEDGTPKVTYHYVMTVDFPYSISCFRGKPLHMDEAKAGAKATAQ